MQQDIGEKKQGTHILISLKPNLEKNGILDYTIWA